MTQTGCKFPFGVPPPPVRSLLSPQWPNKILQTRYLQLLLRLPVKWIPFIPNSYCLQHNGGKRELIGGRSSDLLCFVIKACSTFVSVMAVCSLHEVQVNAWNQPLCGLDMLDLHLGSSSLRQQDRFLGYST